MPKRAAAIWIAAIACTVATQVVLAQSPASFTTVGEAIKAVLPSLSEENRQRLLVEGELSAPVTDGLVTLAPAFAAQIREANLRIEPTIGIEVLFLMENRKGVGIDPELFTTMHAISTMEGLEYYSASRERMRTLFLESWAIDDPENERRIADPTFGTVPPRSSLYIRQRDASFGTNVSRLDYETNARAIKLSMTNLSRMSYRGVVPAVAPEALSLNLVVVPLGDHLLFYGSSVARPFSLLGMQDRVQRSFYNRLVALHDWFDDQAVQ